MNTTTLIRSTLLFAAILLAISGCRNPADGLPSAQLEGDDDASETAPAEATDDEAEAEAPEDASPEEIALNSDNTKIEFVGSKVTGSHDGGFNDFTGTLTLHPTDPTRSALSLEIDMDSTWSDNDRLTGHLKSDDFFDVENHPTATFESTEIREGGEGDATHTIVGRLTLRGVTQRISFPATISIADDKVTAESEFSINRRDFEINYAGAADDLIRNEVVLKLSVDASRS